MAKLFVSLFNFFRTRRFFLYSLMAFFFLVFGLLASRLDFEEDISSILPRDKKIEKLNEIFQNSRFLDKLVVMLSVNDTRNDNPDSLVLFADSFVQSAQSRLEPYVTSISARVDDEFASKLLSSVTDALPVYLSAENYREIDSLTAPATIRESLQNNIRILSSPTGIALKQVIAKDPVGISFIALRKLKELQYDENFELYDNYVITKDHQTILLFMSPKFPPGSTGQNAVFLDSLDSVIETVTTSFPAFKASYFGATAVSVGNAIQLRRDTLLTQVGMLIFLLVLLGLYFKRTSAPLLILIPVLFGAIFSLAIVYLIKGSISVIALGTGAVVLGIAVNYSLHVYNHFRHNGSMQEVLTDLAKPLTIGSLTTIGGFLCFQFVKSEMLKDLGLFAACSLIGASLASLIFLPHLIGDGGNKKHDQKLPNSQTKGWFAKLMDRSWLPGKWSILLILALTAFFGYHAPSVKFQAELSDMNFMSDPLKAAETQLNKINEYALKSIYLVADGNNLDDALLNNEAVNLTVDSLKQKGLIGKSSGVSTLLLSDSLQRQRIAQWNSYWTPEKKASVLNSVSVAGRDLGFRPEAFQGFQSLIDTIYKPVPVTDVMSASAGFLNEYVSESKGKTSVITILKVNPQHTAEVYRAFENRIGVTVIDRQYLTTKFVELINADFTSIALMTSLLVFFVLLIMYGRIELTLVSFIPMLISWIWILGLMSLFNISFNIINIIVSALIFGLGDDYSLFVMDGLLKEYRTGKKNLSSYRSSIFLSAVTAVAGLGVLVFAEHPALRSIALISIIGVLCVVLMSQILIPFFFRALITSRVSKNKFPWTLSSWLISTFAFSYFVLGCLLLVVIGVLFKLRLFGKQTGYVYHVILSKFAWSMMYIMPNVKKVILNPANEKFEKPAVIICNHQSFLDILMMLLLTPKLIMFTNQWVYNSPFFGAVVRMADFYPAAQGAEFSTEILQKKVEEGYSIMIFPEGSRSADLTVHRFHKGAFFVAEKLKMDILPIILHGTGYTMAKSDFMLKNGTVTATLLPRIKPDDTSFGIGYAERTKLIGRYFREEYNTLVATLEQPKYFREKLKYNYIYKGPELEWYMRIKTGVENNYKLFNELLPSSGQILDIGCGYGFLSHTLSFTSDKREIMGIDYDADKVAVANHCFSKRSGVTFEAADITTFDMQMYDGIVMSDVLHYLAPQDQEVVLNRCLTNLKPGGTFILKDGDKELASRHKGTMMTEFISTKFIGFNKTTAAGLSYISAAQVQNIVASHNMICTQIDDTKYTSNITFVITHKENS